ncbi:MAG: hypothetical protein ACP5OJ_07385 [Methanothermobacter sp.]
MVDMQKHWVMVGIGFLILILCISLYQTLSLFTICAVLLAIYFIIVGMLGKSTMVSMMIGVTMLICGLIWISLEKMPLMSLEVIFYFMIVAGIILTAMLNKNYPHENGYKI